MKPTDIADRVEFYNHEYSPLNGEDPLRAHDKTWQVIHKEVNEFGHPGCDSMIRMGFKNRDRAEGFMEGWNAHRNNAKELLFISTTIAKLRKKSKQSI